MRREMSCLVGAKQLQCLRKYLFLKSQHNHPIQKRVIHFTTSFTKNLRRLNICIIAFGVFRAVSRELT